VVGARAKLILAIYTTTIAISIVIYIAIGNYAERGDARDELVRYVCIVRHMGDHGYPK